MSAKQIEIIAEEVAKALDALEAEAKRLECLERFMEENGGYPT